MSPLGEGVFMFHLGQDVVDNVTGFRGKVTARTEWLNGCLRYQLETMHEGEIKEWWFDEDRLSAVGLAEDPGETPATRTGGGRPAPRRTGG